MQLTALSYAQPPGSRLYQPVSPVVPTDTCDLCQAPAELCKAEMAARYTNNVVLHLIGSDGPAALSIAANLVTLPAGLTHFLDAFNVVNTATGVLSIAADLRETHGTFQNPHATELDRRMDVAHLVAGDCLSTAASLTPLITPLAGHPAALAFFVGGQLVGIGMDVAKTVYDFKRKGQQSVH